MSQIDLVNINSMQEEPQDILLVDDDPSIMTLMEDFFETKGISFRTAINGLDAMRLLEENPASIIITDLLMPKMDGMELVRSVKQHWPETDIIVMTGYTKEYRYVDVIKNGASDFIQKPFNLDELEAKLQRVIRERNLRAQLLALSIKDPLTNLYNRRFFNQKLEEEANRAFRQNYDLFLIMVDIDKFKLVNDLYGHEAGDLLLEELARILKKTTRHNVDFACRLGGDEFAVIVPHAETKNAAQIAERIRQFFLQIKRDNCTLSIGIAKLSKELDTTHAIIELIKNADTAMYISKRNNGNQVVAHYDAAGSQ